MLAFTIQYDGAKLHQRDLLHILIKLEVSRGAIARGLHMARKRLVFTSPRSRQLNLGHIINVKIPSRVIRLPIVFDDASTVRAVNQYIETTRSEEVYLPHNAEYLARSNGMASHRSVQEAALVERMLICSVGFFCGVPVGVSLDPRLRMIGQK